MTTLTIHDFFKEESAPPRQSIESGEGFLPDLRAWVSNYRSHLINSHKSKNTIALYGVTLSALEEYSEAYLSRVETIKALPEHLSSFLEWMENYKINRVYGSIRERTAIVLAFIAESSNLSVENFEENANQYYMGTSMHDIERVEFAIREFHDFLRAQPATPIDRRLISAFIASRPRNSTRTMEQRRIAITAFLRHIDKATGENFFEQKIWKIRQYKPPKHTNKLSTGFSAENRVKVHELLNKTDFQKSRPTHVRVLAMMALMEFAGLRSMEALSLKFSDISLSDKKEVYILKVLGKGNKERRVPIDKTLFAPYLDYLSNNRQGEYLSSTRNGSPMQRTNLYVETRKLMRSCGIEQFGLHIFRHDFGSTFASTNGNLKILQQLLGHSSIGVTMIYSQVDDDVVVDAVLAKTTGRRHSERI